MAVTVVKEKPAPKRGGLLHWSLLFLFSGLIPTIALIIIPLVFAIMSRSISFYLVPTVGLLVTFFWVMRKHKKIMALSEDTYQETYKITITKGSDNSFDPINNINDAIASGQFSTPGTPGSRFNSSI